jgi:hypothetical protein
VILLCIVVLQAGGTLLWKDLNSVLGPVLWSSYTNVQGSVLKVNNDASISVNDGKTDALYYTSSNSLSWNQTRAAPFSMFSPSKQYELVLEIDGNLLIRDALQTPPKVVWQTDKRRAAATDDMFLWMSVSADIGVIQCVTHSTLLVAAAVLLMCSYTFLQLAVSLISHCCLLLSMYMYLQDTGKLYVTTSSKDTRFAIWSTESFDKSSRSDFVSLSNKGALCTQTWMNPNGSIVKAPPTLWCSDGSGGSKKTNIAVIAGGIAAGVAFIVAAVIAFICCKRKRQNGKAAATATTAAGASSTVNSNVPSTRRASSRAVQESAAPHQPARHHHGSSMRSSNGHGRPSLVMLLSGKSFKSDKNVTEDVGRDVEIGTANSTSRNGVRDDATAKLQQRQAAAPIASDVTNNTTRTGGIRRGSRGSSGGSSGTAATAVNGSTTTHVDSKSNSSGLKAISDGVASAFKAGIDKHGAKAGIVWEGVGAVAEHIPYVRFAYGELFTTTLCIP